MKAYLRWFFRDFIPNDDFAPIAVPILLMMPIYFAAFIITGIRYFLH